MATTSGLPPLPPGRFGNPARGSRRAADDYSQNSPLPAGSGTSPSRLDEPLLLSRRPPSSEDEDADDWDQPARRAAEGAVESGVGGAAPSSSSLLLAYLEGGSFGGGMSELGAISGAAEEVVADDNEGGPAELEALAHQRTDSSTSAAFLHQARCLQRSARILLRERIGPQPSSNSLFLAASYNPRPRRYPHQLADGTLFVVCAGGAVDGLRIVAEGAADAVGGGFRSAAENAAAAVAPAVDGVRVGLREARPCCAAGCRGSLLSPARSLLRSPVRCTSVTMAGTPRAGGEADPAQGI